MMNKKFLSRTGAAFVAVAALVVGISLVSGTARGSTSVGDHWVNNLGTGTTASDFDGNSSADCTTEEFLAGEYDLWHFVVTSTDGEFAGISWNEEKSIWSDPTVVVTDVTDIYGPSDPTERLRHLWIKTVPSGATLLAANLDYTGTVGNENLSHSCGRTSPTPSIKIDPKVSYDMTWDWTVDKEVNWIANPTGGYSLSYSVESSRSDSPRILPGSLHITDNITVIPSSLTVLTLAVSFTQGSYTEECDVDVAALHYDCEVDISKITIDSITARPTGSGTVSATATYSGGTLTDSVAVEFESIDPTNVYAETATLTDDFATPGDPSDDPTTSQNLVEYSVSWNPTGSTCNERTNTATTLIDNPVPGTDNPSDSVTVRWCPPMKGLTIGYWSNKTGSPIVVSKFNALKTQYPKVFSLPNMPALTSATSVRNFLTSATCSGNCWSMFVAQFLATAMNAMDPAFAAQGVSVNGGCQTVSSLLAAANAGATGATKTWYEKYKSIFDAINNSRQTSCLAVID